MTPDNIPDEDFDASLYGFDISGSFEIPVEWDVLVSASDNCLDGYASGFVEKEIIRQLPASITYRIWQKQLGELGTVEIHKLKADVSQIYISGVPLGSENTAPIWLEDASSWGKKINNAMKGKPKEDALASYMPVMKEIDIVKRRIKAKQKNHQADIIRIYFNRLSRENIWVVGSGNLASSQEIQTSQTGKAGRPRNIEDDWAYDQVRILGRDKQEVYKEWLEKIGSRRNNLSNPQDSFNKAVSHKRGTGK